MVYWTVSVGGGPKLNRAAAAVGDIIYSFGVYGNSLHDGSLRNQITVYALDTTTYRWSRKQLNNFTSLVERGSRKQSIAESRESILNHLIKLGITFGMPDNRTGHTVVAYDGSIYMWGGFTASHRICSLLFCFMPLYDCWFEVKVDGMVPDGRINHTAVIFNDEMVVYGGKTNLRGRLPRETYAYNFKQRKWRLLRINGDVPVGRVFHTSCVIGTKMYVFGGISNDLRDQSMMILNLEKNQWERPQERGDIPIRRSNHCAWVYKNKMYIYGGFQNTDDQQMGIVHEFDPETSSWRKLKPCGFNGPGERHRHGAVVVNNRLFLFAGIAQMRPTLEHPIRYAKDMTDLHVLDFDWKLKDIAAITVLKHRKVIPVHVLPETLR